MEAQNMQSGEELLREIERQSIAANRAAMRLNLTFIAIPILFTAALWLFAMLTN